MLSIPGPIDGATTSATNYTPPQVLITMTATAAPSTTARTSFEQFAVTRSGAGIPTAPGAPPATQTVTCPVTSPAPVMSRTRILDVTPPLAVLASPKHGGVFTIGDAVTVDFACGDPGGTISTCSGTSAKGSQLSTSTAGTRSFTVDATDSTGNAAQAFASYLVVPATVTYTANVDWAMLVQMNATAARFHIPIQDLPKAGVGLLLYFRALDPSANPTPITPPPANNGPIAIPSTYPYSQKATIDDLAAFYSVNADQLHYVGTQLLIFLNVVSGG